MVDFAGSLNSLCDIIKDNYTYDTTTGRIYNKYTDELATTLWKNSYSVVRIARRSVFSQHIAWFLSYGEWPSNFICRLDGNEYNDRLNNLIMISDQTIRARKSLTRGHIKIREHKVNKHIVYPGIETYTICYNPRNKECKQTYLGKFHTIQDARYRVYIYNVERKRENRSILADIERNSGASV